MNYNQGYYMDDYANNASYINYPQNRGYDNGYDSQEKFSKHDDSEKCMCCMRTVCYYPISWEDDCRKKDDHKKPCFDQEKEEERPCCRCNQNWNDEKYDCKKKDDDDCYDDKKSNHCGCKKEDTDKKHCENNSRCCKNNRCCGWFCRGFRF